MSTIENEYDEKLESLKMKFGEVSQLFSQLNSLCEIEKKESFKNEPFNIPTDKKEFLKDVE